VNDTFFFFFLLVCRVTDALVPMLFLLQHHTLARCAQVVN
jgi:hypothetical protein